MSSKKLQVEGQFDGRGIDAGIDASKRKLGELGPAAKRAGDQVKDGLDAIPEGMQRGAQEVDRASRRMAASIERITAATKAGGSNTSAFFEDRIGQRGLNADYLAPYIEGLKKAEAAQAAASRSLGGMEISAKQTQAALRGVPAQFTDIVTSLQGGQNPLTVFLQQGGQLKDMFGGAGNAARALGGYVLGLVNPFSVAAVAAGVLAVAYESGGKESREFSRSLIMTGNEAGVTSSQLAVLSAEVSNLSGGTVGKAANVLNQLAQSGIRGGDALRQYADAAIALERAGGPAVEETAKAFARLKSDPVGAVKALNDQINFLTPSLYAQIKALQESGRSSDAAKLASQAYADTLKQRTPEMEAQLGSLERAWRSVKDAVTRAWDAIKSVGRADGVDEQIAAIQKRIADIDALKRGGQLDVAGLFRGGADAERARLEEQLKAKQKVKDFDEVLAAQEARKASATNAAIKLADNFNGYLSKEEQLRKNIENIVNTTRAAKAGATAEEIANLEKMAQRMIALEKQRADPGVNAQRIKDSEALMIEAISQSQAEIDRLREQGGLNEQAYLEKSLELNLRVQDAKIDAAKREMAIVQNKQDGQREYAALEGQLAVLRLQRFGIEEAGRDKLTYAIRQQEIAIRSLFEAMKMEDFQAREEQFNKDAAARLAVQQVTSAWEKELSNQNAQLALESSLIGKSSRERAVAIEQMRIQLRLQEEEKRVNSVVWGSSEDREREIQRVRAAATIASQQAVQRSVLDEWTKTVEGIYSSLTDALMRAFESGKGFGKALADTLRNAFKTLVLQPVVKAIFAPVGGAIGSMFGMAGPAGASAVGGGGNAGGLMQMLGSSFGGNFGNQVAFMSDSAGAWMMNNTTGAANQAGGWMMQNAGSIGSAAGMLGNAFAGYGVGMALNSGISGGYSAGKGYNQFQQVGMAVASAIGGPVMGAIVGAATGLMNRAFGRRPREYGETGVEGTVSGSGFSGQQFASWSQRGGWFRSNRSGRDMSAVTKELDDTLDAGVRAVFTSAQSYAEALGLPADAARNFSASFRVVWGKTEEENKKAIEDAIGKLSDDLAGVYAQYLTPLKRAGETIGQTLQRLGVLQTFSKNINELGGVFSRVANLSIDAREAIIGMAGGMDAFADKAKNFAQEFYGRDEIAGLKARDVQSQLAALGVSGVNSREDFRRIVEGTDVSAEEGQRRLVSLLDIAGPFAEVADYLAETGKSLSEAARQAPETSVLAPLFSDSSNAQVQAINAVSDGVGSVVNRLDQLLALVREAGSSASQVFVASEIQLVDNPGGA